MQITGSGEPHRWAAMQRLRNSSALSLAAAACSLPSGFAPRKDGSGRCAVLIDTPGRTRLSRSERRHYWPSDAASRPAWAGGAGSPFAPRKDGPGRCAVRIDTPGRTRLPRSERRPCSARQSIRSPGEFVVLAVVSGLADASRTRPDLWVSHCEFTAASGAGTRHVGSRYAGIGWKVGFRVVENSPVAVVYLTPPRRGSSECRYPESPLPPRRPPSVAQASVCARCPRPAACR